MNHLKMAHLLMEAVIREGDHVVDMTLGNGHDLRKLLSLCGPCGKVTGFDIAAQAIQNCTKVVGEFPDHTVDLRHTSHEHCEDLAPFTFAVYNLGYLPGSDKTITTRAESTLRSLTRLLPKLEPNGLICITAYRAHDQNKESDALRNWLADRKDLRVRSWQILPDDGHSPILYAVERKEPAL